MGTELRGRIIQMRQHLGAVTLADVFDVRVLGFALSLAWVYIVFFSTTVHFSTRNDVSHFNSVFGFSSVGVLAVLLIGAFVSRPFARAMRFAALRWASPFVMAVSTAALVAVDLSVVWQPWCSIASVGAGVGLGVMYLAWGEVFRGFSMSGAIVKTAASFLLAALLFALVVALPRSAGVAITVTVPLAVGSILFGVLGVWRTPSDVQSRPVRRGAFSVRALLSLGVLSLTESLMRALFFNASPIINEGSYPWLFLVATIAAAGTVATLLFTARDLDFGAAYKACVFVLAFVFLLLPILDLGSFVADLLALVIYCLVALLVWTVLVRIAGLYALPALLVFGVGWGAYVAGSLVGMFGGALIGSFVSLEPRTLSIIALTCSCLVFLTYLFLFSEPFMNRLTRSDALQRVRRVRTGRAPFRERCRELSEDRGLTPREEEVMVLLAKGRSTPRICAALNLTAGTVNTHLTHLYRKLDVHDKQELIDLLEDSPVAE